MKNKAIIFIGIALVIIIALPYLTNFSIYSNALVFPYAVQGFGVGATATQYNSLRCQFEGNNPIGPDIGSCSSTYGTADYGVNTDFGCSGTSCSKTKVVFDLVNSEAKTVNNEVQIPPYLNIYYYDSGRNDKVYYSINTPISCDSNGCTGNSITPTNVAKLTNFRIDLSNYKGQAIYNIYIASHSIRDDKSGNPWGAGVVTITSNLRVCLTDACTSSGGDSSITFQSVILKAQAWQSGSVTFQQLIDYATTWVNS